MLNTVSISKENMSLYTRILQQELQTAMGCTEPIALAYAAAYAKKILGKMPTHCVSRCSGNIIKNVKAVTVPATGGMKGIEAATLAGICGGDADKKLEVLTTLTDADREQLRSLMGSGLVETARLESEHPLHIIVEMSEGADSVSVEIVDTHTNIADVIRNGEYLHRGGAVAADEEHVELDVLGLADILSYAETVDLSEVRPVLEHQISCNTAISDEGMTGKWGAAVGKTLMELDGERLSTRMRAAAAAGSDARMNGCALPVVINSGSGNQGMTVSLPVVVYAREKNIPEEKMLRGLCVANLVALHQKAGIGALSAFCGAVCAATGAVAGVAWLDGQSYDVIAQTITNSLAAIGGMVCDGAKSSCAGKIACALECAFMGYEMAKKGFGYLDGEGIVGPDVEVTVANVGRMAKEGMRSTDTEILKIMIGEK